MLAIIQEKVNNPSPDDPFEPEIATVRLTFAPFVLVSSIVQLLKNDKAKFLATAKEYTKKSVSVWFRGTYDTEYFRYRYAM